MRNLLVVVLAAFLAAPVAGCATVSTTVEAEKFASAPRACKAGESGLNGLCFDTVRAPAGRTVETRDNWCTDHPGLCAGAILTGVALLGGGTAAVWCAASGNCVPEGGHFDARGAQPGGR